MKKYNKLVRDNIPDIIRNNGENPIIEILDDDRYKKELEKKLLEECEEVIEASNDERVLELADLLEVIRALALLENKTLEEIIQVADKKSIERGAFFRKIFLVDVSTLE